jgi:hypothetical protein
MNKCKYVAPPDTPLRPLFEEILICIILESFHVFMTYSGSVVLEIFKWPHHIFCDYLLFEEDLALYLNHLKFPLSKDDLY